MRHQVSRFTGGGGHARTLARGLGWFSIALGAAELLAPRRLDDAIGGDHNRNLVRAYGLRELTVGIGLLSASDQRPWIWGRIAGDVVDLATLAPALGRSNPQRTAACVAFGAVAAVTALDILCASQLQREFARVPRQWRRPAWPPRDYSDRSGFPKPPDEMRGKGRRIPEPAAPSQSWGATV